MAGTTFNNNGGLQNGHSELCQRDRGNNSGKTGSINIRGTRQRRTLNKVNFTQMIILHRVNTDNRVAIKTIARNESFTRYAIDHDGWSTDDPPPMGISKWFPASDFYESFVFLFFFFFFFFSSIPYNFLKL